MARKIYTPPSRPNEGANIRIGPCEVEDHSDRPIGSYLLEKKSLDYCGAIVRQGVPSFGTPGQISYGGLRGTGGVPTAIAYNWVAGETPPSSTVIQMSVLSPEFGTYIGAISINWTGVGFTNATILGSSLLETTSRYDLTPTGVTWDIPSGTWTVTSDTLFNFVLPNLASGYVVLAVTSSEFGVKVATSSTMISGV